MFSSQRSGKEPLLRFVNIKKSFGRKNILKELSFDIYEGELFGLIGRSGAGKTTLLRILIGYYPLDSGYILYRGQDISKNVTKIRQIFGFATQDACFYDELSPIDNIDYFGRMQGLTQEQVMKRAEELLKLVDLWPSKDIPAMNLSGGMQRRLDIAISLINNPKVLILDEPTTGLDPMLRKGLWGLIKKINDKGVTIIMSSHLLDEMENLCNDVAMIKEGKLLIKGSPKQLKYYYSKNQEVQIESYPGNYKVLLKALQQNNISTFYPRHEISKLIFYTPDIDVVLRMLPNIMKKTGETLTEISIEKPNLNEVFEAFSTYN